MYTLLRSKEVEECLSKPKQSFMGKFANFDVADYLDSEETIADFLTAALEDEDPAVFLAAISVVAKAQGMAVIASSTGLGRES